MISYKYNAWLYKYNTRCHIWYHALYLYDIMHCIYMISCIVFIWYHVLYLYAIIHCIYMISCIVFIWYHVLYLYDIMHCIYMILCTVNREILVMVLFWPILAPKYEVPKSNTPKYVTLQKLIWFFNLLLTDSTLCSYS
jgi:hypothetical protein